MLDSGLRSLFLNRFLISYEKRCSVYFKENQHISIPKHIFMGIIKDFKDILYGPVEANLNSSITFVVSC